jgi:hypothetical protein
MKRKNLWRWMLTGLVVVPLAVLVAWAGTTTGALTFTNTPLLRANGASEPAVSIAAGGQMALTGLDWIDFGTNLWTGTFTTTPTDQGTVDAALQQPGKRIFGGGDADVDLGSTGTLHASTLIFLVNPSFRRFQLGVSAITCPNAIAGYVAANCVSQIIDKAGADRQWISSDGAQVYISYHDAGNSSLIHVQRSDDDGLNWRRAGDPVPGQGRFTGDATFNNEQGPIVADPFTHNVYSIYSAGEPGIQKAKNTDFNHIFVSRSTDLGQSWTANLVYTAPVGTELGNVFPSLAVDPTNGKLYAVWSDGHNTFFSTSSDQGATWSSAAVVNIAPANTAIFTWVAAYGGTVDVVYYGTPASSKDDPAAVWNVYLAQTTNDGASFAQSRVSNTSNHTGVICTEGTGCAAGTRNLLDLFEVAINPQNKRAAIIYTDDTISKTSSGAPLPQVVLARQQ